MRSPTRLLAILSSACVIATIPPFAVASDSSTPGALVVHQNDGVTVEMPLRHTKVSIEVTAFVARATIEQVFDNPFADPVEAVYTYPLGHRAAVDDFELVVGDRTIKGAIKRREEARADYVAARSAGFRAALLEQARPNIFTQSVANLEPGKPITVRLRTVENVPYERGSYRLTFPLVVAPRYDARKAASDQEKLTPPTLEPGTRSGHDVEIMVTIDAGVPLSNLESPSHRTVVVHSSTRGAVVRLADDDTIPNKDFILRWSVASEMPALGLLAHRDGLDGLYGVFTLLVQPKGEIGPTEAAPKEITFVLDTSGSMSGIPIEASKRFAAQALRSLGPHDTFNLIRFAGDNEVYSKNALPNEANAVEAAIAWFQPQSGGGGTELLAAMRAAFARPADPNRLRVVIFLTDGQVGDDDEILTGLSKVVGHARIYTVGIGTSVNHDLLERMASLGRGSYVFVRPDESADDALRAFQSWVTLPYLTDLTIDWGALPVADISPERLPDLGSGQTLSVVGLYLAPGEGNVVVRGKLGGRYWEQALHVVLPEREPNNAALGALWARGRIDELLRDPGDPIPESIAYEATAMALQYRLMSPFTSFVAIDDAYVVNPSGSLRFVRQAVPIPEGTSLEGIFGNEGPTGLQPYGEAIDESEDIHDSEAEEDPVVTAASAGTSGGLRIHVIDSSDKSDVVGAAVAVSHPNKLVATSTRTSTQFSSDFIAATPVAGRFYQSVLALAPGVQDPDEDGNPNVSGARERYFKTTVSGISNVDRLTGQFVNLGTSDSIEDLTVISAGAGAEFGRVQCGFAVAPRDSDEHLRETAFRVLADLADDGRLSPAEGIPALAALLGALQASGEISDDVATQAIATWALAEAAVRMTSEPWVSHAWAKSVAYLIELRQPGGWPAQPKGAVSAAATRWVKLALGQIGPAGVLTGSKHKPVGHSPYDRLVRTIGRGYLKTGS